MKKISNKIWIRDGLAYITGSALYALSVSVFSTPNDIASGGATGLGIIAHALWNIPVGMVVLCLNVPLLVAAFFLLSHGFVWRTAVVTVLSSVMIDISSSLVNGFRGDPLLAALCGGLLGGVGIGLIMLRFASTGGSEIAARLLRLKYPHLSVGRLILFVDAVVVGLSAMVFGELSAALYAAVQVFVSSLMIDRMVYGPQEGRLLLVVTSHARSLCRLVGEQLSRGVTVLPAFGGYSGSERAVVLCAVSRSQVPHLKSLILQADTAAFVMMVDTRQVMGEGFLHGNEWE